MKALPRPNYTPPEEAAPARREYSSFLPILLIMLVLTLSAARDNLNLYHHIKTVRAENRNLKSRLEQTGKKTAFDEKLKAGLIETAPNDPVAARIVQDFFPGGKGGP